MRSGYHLVLMLFGPIAQKESPVKIKLILGSLLVMVITGQPILAVAQEVKNGVARELVSKLALPNLDGHNLTAVTVELDPGISAPAHMHDAFVFVYVLKGKVKSQLGNAVPVEFSAGESWSEAPKSVHTLTQNLSTTDHAKLLVVFIGKEGAKLTTSGKISH